MNHFALLLLGLLWVAGLPAQNKRLTVAPLAPGVWVHTTYQKGIPSNGLIIEDGDRVLIVDTGWGKKPTRKLLHWVRKHLHKPVGAIFISHWHDDRTGGLAYFEKKKIPIRMNIRTAEAMEAHGVKVPSFDALSDDGYEMLTNQRLQYFYPGPGHTTDNMVFFLENGGVLFGGCLVKSLEATGMGYIDDANLAEWPNSIRRLRIRFPGANTFIPGHQAWGGPELLTHTLDLLAKAQQK